MLVEPQPWRCARVQAGQRGLAHGKRSQRSRRGSSPLS
jgi:hypothetical protein